MQRNGSSQALVSWKMLVGSLPRGIVAFVVAVAGLCVGLPLAVFGIGLPVLAGMLLVCGKIMGTDRRLVADWESGESAKAAREEGATGNEAWPGSWREWLRVLRDARNYRGLVYGIGQFPVSILAFTLAVLVPAVGIALLLSPLAQWASVQWFSFDLFQKDAVMHWLFPEWTSMQRAWFNAGLGAIIGFGIPFLFRKMGEAYAAWIRLAAGSIR